MAELRIVINFVLYILLLWLIYFGLCGGLIKLVMHIEKRERNHTIPKKFLKDMIDVGIFSFYVDGFLAVCDELNKYLNGDFNINEFFVLESQLNVVKNSLPLCSMVLDECCVRKRYKRVMDKFFWYRDIETFDFSVARELLKRIESQS